MDIVNKLWGFCNKLRHDGVDSSDYIEQLTYLLFLKMAEERGINVPKGYDWQSLINTSTRSLIPHLEAILQKLRTKKGILGDIFSEPVSRVRNAEILKGLINEIDSIEWTSFDADIVGLAFEELIGKVANEGKKGAGQYFTPRPLIQAIVNVMKPDPLQSKSFNIGDVATGTAGFLVVAYEWHKQNSKGKNLTTLESNRIKNNTFYGQELVQRPRRLALMNMFLHGVNAQIRFGDSLYGKQNNDVYDCILTNPPFGNKGANQIPNRKFPVKTSDKQLNFIQHIIEKLKDGGRAAIVLPDSCLSSEAAKKIWAHYLDSNKSGADVCNLHTILKLPEGVFAAYANGIKACVIFLKKGEITRKMWTYDARKDNVKVTTKSNSLSPEHFHDFEECYGVSPNGDSRRNETTRFKVHTLNEIKEKKYDLAFVELFQSEILPHPAIIIDEMIADYERKILALKKLKNNLPKDKNEPTKKMGKYTTS
ncbi:MAG TPA: class I SAM-dependent DNA methyltransferase [Cytophagaceae bacterium]|jgi:type I restriction enzyme M protein|nr:class I SAM-dependent DNA methyltransferase [Cytophagaceae bacterium]